MYSGDKQTNINLNISSNSKNCKINSDKLSENGNKENNGDGNNSKNNL